MSKTANPQDNILRAISDISRLKSQSKTDNEIMDVLALQPKTYQRYVQRMSIEDRVTWARIAREQLETEMLRLKESLEHTYQRAKNLADDR